MHFSYDKNLNVCYYYIKEGEMELRSLRYFLAVAQEENITKAADLLHVSQPALSRQMSILEDELGVTLFERKSHRIKLTQDGLLLQRSAMEMVELADKTQAQFAKKENSVSGTISIGCGELLSVSPLAAAMTDFRRKYPKVMFDVYSGNADSIKLRLNNGLLDFGLLVEPVDISDYDFIRLNIREKWGIYTRFDSPLGRKRSIQPWNLAHTTLLLSKREAVQNEVINWLGPYARTVDIAGIFNLNYNGMAAVRQGLGIAVSIQLECRYDKVKFIPLDPPVTHSSAVVWKKNQPHSKTIQTFLDYLQNRLKPTRRHP